MSANIGPETTIYSQLATRVRHYSNRVRLSPRVVRANMTYPRESPCSILGS